MKFHGAHGAPEAHGDVLVRVARKQAREDIPLPSREDERRALLARLFRVD